MLQTTTERLTTRLREATAAAHDDAENSGFMSALLDGELHACAAADLAGQLWFVYGALEDAVNAGVHAGYIDGCLRKSALSDPLIVRKNTGDNTPAIIHTRLVPGDRLSITIAPKGAGRENMSALGMLKPAQGREGVLRFVVDAVSRAGSNPCPPVIVGVGIGGTIDKTTYLAKRALLREVGAHHPDPAIAAFEAEALAEINRLGIGAQGFGGTVTALAVHVETFPAHLASLPVAVNLQCHVARHKTAVL